MLDGLLREHTPAHVPGLPPFTAGAVGFFAHDAVRQIEKLPVLAKDDLQMPDCTLMFFDRLLAFDHVRHEIFIIATADVRRQSPKQAYAQAVRDIARIEKQLAAPLPAKFLRAPRPNSRQAEGRGLGQQKAFPAHRGKNQGLHHGRRRLPGRAVFAA